MLSAMESVTKIGCVWIDGATVYWRVATDTDGRWRITIDWYPEVLPIRTGNADAPLAAVD